MTNFIDIKPNEKCLVIAPHPDDESIGCGGLILKYPDSIDVIVLTDGRKGGIDDEDKIAKVRYLELKQTMEYAKIKNWQNLMIHDREVHNNLDIIKKINFKKYDYIFVPYENEFHIDHKPILKIVKKCLKSYKKTKIISYEVWSPIPNPDLYLNISDIKQEKETLISHYKSQLQYNDYTNRTLSLNKYRGMLAGCDYAEAYLLDTKKRISFKIFGIKFSMKI